MLCIGVCLKHRAMTPGSLEVTGGGRFVLPSAFRAGLPSASGARPASPLALFLLLPCCRRQLAPVISLPITGEMKRRSQFFLLLWPGFFASLLNENRNPFFRVYSGSSLFTPPRLESAAGSPSC